MAANLLRVTANRTNAGPQPIAEVANPATRAWIEEYVTRSFLARDVSPPAADARPAGRADAHR